MNDIQLTLLIYNQPFRKPTRPLLSGTRVEGGRDCRQNGHLTGHQPHVPTMDVTRRSMRTGGNHHHISTDGCLRSSSCPSAPSRLPSSRDVGKGKPDKGGNSSHIRQLKDCSLRI